MRYVDPTIEPIPAAINYSNIAAALDNLLNHNGRANSDIYQGITPATGLEKTVLMALKSKYRNKCGYCESYEYEPCVEHHRPKGFTSGRLPHNRGYYWLAYEWTNMVAACDTCNQPPYKGTKYPIINRPGNTTHPVLAYGTADYASFRYYSSYNSYELPTLLHPEYCVNPNDHFTFELDGTIHALSPNATESIEVYGLGRSTLNVLRREIYNAYMSELKQIVYRRFRPEPCTTEVFNESVGGLLSRIVDRANDPDQSYTLFVSFMLDNLLTFFIDPFSEIEVRNELTNAFGRGLRILGRF